MTSSDITGITTILSANIVIVICDKACEDLGAGEVMLNCIDMDGQGNGYDLPLLAAVQAAVTIPVIASSGAGAVEHFSEVRKLLFWINWLN